MGNYTTPCRFQNMKVLNVPAAGPSPENVKELEEAEQDIHTHTERLLSVGISDDKIHVKGQYAALERINRLVDKDTSCSLNTLYNPGDNAEGKIGIVSTGVIKDLGHINDKRAMIIVSDSKEMTGAWVPGQADNLFRGSDTAKILGTPLAYILNCSGVKLGEQGKAYPNRRGGDTPSYRNSELNRFGAPVIVGIYGTNPTGGGYHTIPPTVLIAREKANMAAGGVGTVGGMGSRPYVDLESAQGMIGATGKMKSNPSGSVSIHYNVTGFFREAYAEEFGVPGSIRKYMDYISAFDPEFFQADAPRAPAIQGEELYDIVPYDTRRTCDTYNILKVPLDGDEFMEYKKDYSPEMITGIMKASNLPVGVVANRQGVLAIQGYSNYSKYRGKGAMDMGGGLYYQGLIKVNEFMTLCGRDCLPVIWVQDTTGIDVDNETEKAELLGPDQSLIHSTQSTKFPMFEITLCRGTATAYYVLGGPQGNDSNVFPIGTVATEINVMYGKTAAGAMYSCRLVRNQGSGKDPRGTIDKVNQLIQHYIDTSIPACYAKAGLIGEIVDTPKIRNYIVAFADAAYQNPKSICPVHRTIFPRIIEDYDENSQNAKTVGAKA